MSKIQSVKLNNATGFSIIELLIVVVVIGIIAAIALPDLLKSRRAANEASAIATVRVITRSEAAFKFANNSNSFGTMAQLYADGHLDESIGSPPHIKNGYSFSVRIFAPTLTIPAKYDVEANPTTHSLDNSLIGTGSKNFGATESGVIYQTELNTPVTFNNTTRLPIGSVTPFGY